MTRGTRNFLTGSAIVVALGLGTGLVAYYNGTLPIGASRAVFADLAYMPSDASAVAYADVRAIMASEFRQKLRQILPTGEELTRLKTDLGVDLEQDIDTVAAAYLGGSSSGQLGVVVVRGRFNEGQIEGLATQHGAVVGEYKGKRLLTAPERTAEHAMTGPDHSMPAIAFLEAGVLALGEVSAVKRAIDAGATGDDIRKNAQLFDVINDVSTAGNAWFVARLDALAAHEGMPAEIRDHLPAVDVFAASVHVNGGVRGALRADARDDKAAEQLRDVIRGALAAGRLVSGEDPRVNAMLNSLQITGTGKTVGLTFSVAPELLDILNGIAAAHELGTGK